MTFNSSLPLIRYCNHAPVGLPARPGCFPGSNSDSFHRERRVLRAPRSAYRSRLKEIKGRNDRDLGWNIEFATTFLVNHLEDASSKVADTLNRVRSRAQHGIHNGLPPLEIPFRAFEKLDETLFAGYLRDAVYLSIVKQGPHVSGTTYAHGHGPDERVRHITITINSEAHTQPHSSRILATLIHQMIHAYFVVACGPQTRKNVEYGRLDHGFHFAKILYTIKELSGANREPLPLDHIYTNNNHPYYGYEYCRPRYLRPAGKWFCSNCHNGVESIDELEVNEWYDSHCAPMLELPDTVQKQIVLIYDTNKHELKDTARAQTTPSSESIEFLFDEKAVLVPYDKLDPYPNVRKAFDKSRFLVIPEDTQEETFLSLLELFHKGHYSPDIRPMTAPGHRGPPIIKGVRSESAPFLLTDIRMFKLASALDFTDIKGLALSRLTEQVVTYEDPVSVLQAIYKDDAEPDKDLRSWARQFLIKSPNEWDSAGERSNLGKLECEMSFRERFLDLYEHCDSLKIDVMKVKDALLWNGRGNLGRSPPLPPYIRDDIDLRPPGLALPYDLPRGGAMSADMFQNRRLPYPEGGWYDEGRRCFG